MAVFNDDIFALADDGQWFLDANFGNRDSERLDVLFIGRIVHAAAIPSLANNQLARIEVEQNAARFGESFKIGHGSGSEIEEGRVAGPNKTGRIAKRDDAVHVRTASR